MNRDRFICNSERSAGCGEAAEAMRLRNLTELTVLVDKYWLPAGGRES